MSFALATEDATVPTAPVITVGSPQISSLTLSLTSASVEPINGIFGYDIELSTDQITWTYAAFNYTGGFPYIAVGLQPNTTYYFRARGISNSDGVYRSRASAVVSGATTNTVSGGATRRYAGGHYIAIRPQDITASGIKHCGTVSGTYPNATVTLGASDGPSNAGPAVRSSADGKTGSLVTAGFVVRLNWNDVETTLNTFDYSLPDKFLAQGKAVGVPIVFLIIGRTFNGSTTGTFTSDVSGQTSGLLNAASSSGLTTGTHNYGASFSDGTVRNSCSISAPDGSGRRTLSWTGALPSPAAGITSATLNLMSNSPLPTDLRGFAECFISGVGTTAGGWQFWRWSPTLRSRFNNLCSKFAARYNDDPFFAGLATQETASSGASGGSATTYTVGNYTGKDQYSAAGYQLGIDDESDSVSSTCTKARHFGYQNFLTGGQNLLTNYAAYIQPNGAVFGGPDLVTGSTSNGNIVSQCYPNYTLYHNGSNPVPKPGPTFCSAQNGEWNGTGVGDSPPVMGNLFNYGTSSFSIKTTGCLDWSGAVHGQTSPLNLDIIVWDYENDAGSPNFTNDLVPIMKAFPIFGTWVPPSSTPTNFIYVDLNASTNGTGLGPSVPTNQLPQTISDNTTLLFNADHGIQTMPQRVDCMYPIGNNIKISSYTNTPGTKAVLSAYQQFTSGWTLVSGTVYSRSFNPTNGGAGNVINMSDTTESPQGTVMKWTNFGAQQTTFNAAALPTGFYAYDFNAHVMYVNTGGNANSVTLGLAQCSRCISVQAASSPTTVEVQGLRFIGFGLAAVNIVRAASFWHVHQNQFYATGGQWSTSSQTYNGTGIQMSNTANNIEIDNNLIEQTYDSPVSPQHFGNSTGDTLDTIHVHHNTISKWANAAIEISDFGSANVTQNINFEFNIATGGGLGYSGIGDEVGNTDGFQIRGGPTSSLNNLRCANNTIQAVDGNVAVRNNNATDQLVVTGNRLSGAKYGIYNTRTQIVVNATNNTMCANSVSAVQDVNNSPNTALNNGTTYTGNSSQVGTCTTPVVSGQGIQTP